jgi:hypothetical protein
MAQPNAKWYDNATLEEMHADLTTEYVKTMAVISDRPSLLRHFRACPECQTIRTAQEGVTEAPVDMPHRELLQRRKIYRLGIADLTKLLGLPANAGILFLGSTAHGDALEVTVCSPDFDPVLYGVEPPRVQLEAS